jgi:putative ABC transport system substrate-binding protein
VIALLVNPKSPNTQRMVQDTREAARRKGVQLAVLEASSASDFERAFAGLSQTGAGGLVVAADPLFNARREDLVALAQRQKIPATYEWREFVAAGGLISYGPSLAVTYRQAGVYAGRILKGEKPADLPVQQPTTFELVVNLKTAAALGLTIRPSILARADEVIE